MEFRNSQTRSKCSKRKALVDVTNTAVSSFSSTYLPKIKEETAKKWTPRSVAVQDTGDGSSIGSCQSAKASSRKVELSASSGVHGGSVILEPVIPCTHQRAKNLEKKQKGKEKAHVEATPSSCPPLKRIKKSRENQTKPSEQDGDQKGSSSVPHPKPKRTWRYILSEDDDSQPQMDLPQQFIEEQKAYFAEVDAFDLVEEVVSETELE